MQPIERRAVLRLALVAAAPWGSAAPSGEGTRAGAARAVVGGVPVQPGQPEAPGPYVPPAWSGSRAQGLDAAFATLDALVPLAAPVLGGGPVPDLSRRLPRTRSRRHPEPDPSGEAVTYDCALVVLAFLARGSAADLERSTTVGDVLVALQESDTELDGRFRESYTASQAIDAEGRPCTAAPAASAGSQAWAGIALLALHGAVDDDRFLVAALRLARALGTTGTTPAPGPRGLPAGGEGTVGRELPPRPTEDDVSRYAFYSTLSRVSADPRWAGRAADARRSVESSWCPERGCFITTTDQDGTVPEVSVTEAAQSWAYLALRDPAHARGLDWASERLAARDGDVHGVRACAAANPETVPLEGAAHLAAALTVRSTETADASGDLAQATALLESVWLAQAVAPLRTGATAWAILAALGANPLAVAR